ncbi:hypothetical protein H5410_060829 [Solanum commersonii]|uniref:glutathione transferase n=1 Tax=Solanum commersonii TaxID=4109 RepID=A0A9J5W6U2_SOLCO|nr:hypothetical protein H5410_060829 [Solanum commersonii]
MARNDLKLLGAWPSPYVMRTRIALNIKSLAYDFLEVQFGTKSELLLKSNPIYKKIPVLIHDGKPICESLIIVQYIDENWTNFGHSILPSHPYDRAIARFWASYIDDKWFPALRGVAATQEENAKKAATETVIEGLVLLEDVFKNCSKGKKFFGGDKIEYLDIALGCFLGWLKIFVVIVLVKDVMPETDKLAQAAKLLRKLAIVTNNANLLRVLASQFVNHVEIALKIKSIETDFIQQNMLNKSELLLKSNPVYKKIPVLIHDEKPNCESLVVLQYIDEACLNAVSQGEDAIKATLEPVFDSLVLLEDTFKNCNKGKKFFGGDKIGYMDIALGCFLRLMRVTEKMNNVTLLNEAKIPGLYK